VRWEDLFGDLEAQLEAQARREQGLEVADRTRRERALVGLHERIVAHRGASVDLSLLGGHLVNGVVVDAGDGWMLLREPRGHVALVPFAAVARVRGLGTQAAAGQAVIRARRFGLGFALRALSRDRATVSIGDVTGRVLTGTIDGVGSDAIEVSEHPIDLPRRPENLTASTIVVLTALAFVRSR